MARSGAQKKTLISLLQKDPRLRAGKFSNDFTHKDAQDEWEKIGNHLNAIPGGAKKDWKAWRKTWQDMKKHATTKHSTQKKEINKTGGGSPAIIKVTDDDQMILEMISKKKLDGLDNVVETEVPFNFEDDLITTPKSLVFREAENQPGCSGTTSNFNIYNTPPEPVIEDVEVENINYGTSEDEEHGYSLKYPSENHPKKRLSKSRRLESSVKVSQQMLQNFGQKNEIIEHYYQKKIEFFEHKKAHDGKILKAIEENNRLIAQILHAITLLVSKRT